MTGAWTQVGNERWTIGNRYWSDPDWGNDVTAYFYDQDSGKLYLSTSGFYGSAGVYILDVRQRTYERTKFRDEPGTTEEGRYTILSSRGGALCVRYEDTSITFEDTVLLTRR
jgi:hypothetical protein